MSEADSYSPTPVKPAEGPVAAAATSSATDDAEKKIVEATTAEDTKLTVSATLSAAETTESSTAAAANAETAIEGSEKKSMEGKPVSNGESAKDPKDITAEAVTASHPKRKRLLLAAKSVLTGTPKAAKKGRGIPAAAAAAADDDAAKRKKKKAPEKSGDAKPKDRNKKVYDGPPEKKFPGNEKWPEGWREERYLRALGGRVADSYFYPPDQPKHRLRSIKEVMRYLKVLKETQDPEQAWKRRMKG